MWLVLHASEWRETSNAAGNWCRQRIAMDLVPCHPPWQRTLPLPQEVSGSKELYSGRVWKQKTLLLPREESESKEHYSGRAWEQRTLLLPQEELESKQLYCFHRKSLRAKNFTASIKVKNLPYSATAQDTKTCSKAHWRALWSTLHSNTEASCTCTWAHPPPRQSDRTQTLPLHG